MIRAATFSDLDSIGTTLETIVAAMRAAGNDQWGLAYPTPDHFAADCREGSLFVDDQDGKIRGFAALNFEEPEEYEPLPWTVGRPALVVHRLAVVPEYRRQGVADGLFAFAETMASTRKLAGLRSDTYSRNPAMNALFAKRGWRLVGTLNFPGREAEFLAWEKNLVLG
jgi:GNAT superfamily N-acetyltransferase